MMAVWEKERKNENDGSLGKSNKLSICKIGYQNQGTANINIRKIRRRECEHE